MKDLSPEERAVILAMRQSDMAGDAIFQYAVNFDKKKIRDPNAEPYVRDESMRRR
jgi:hypothetical protein